MESTASGGSDETASGDGGSDSTFADDGSEPRTTTVVVNVPKAVPTIIGWVLGCCCFAGVLGIGVCIMKKCNKDEDLQVKPGQAEDNFDSVDH